MFWNRRHLGITPTPRHLSSFRSALRVDPLVKGDWETVKEALVAAGLPATAEGAKSYLKDWVETMKPEYLMVGHI